MSGRVMGAKSTLEAMLRETTDYDERNALHAAISVLDKADAAIARAERAEAALERATAIAASMRSGDLTLKAKLLAALECHDHD